MKSSFQPFLKESKFYLYFNIPFKIFKKDNLVNEHFLDEVFKLLKYTIKDCKSGTGKVIDFKTPDELVR